LSEGDVAIQENKDPFNWIAALQLTLSLAMTSLGPPLFFYAFFFVIPAKAGI
jgi:hypothetical protein